MNIYRSMESEPFQAEVDSVVPIFCDGSEDKEKCKRAISKAVMCTSFSATAQRLVKHNEVQGVDNFLRNCNQINKQVPNLAEVMQWIKNPSEIFSRAVAGAEAKTGLHFHA
eukprot:GEMP01108974.1.p1 GENE.GEMP01108974.1~~GEMP01108974.1.p1  ORF type:complete len:111 (+),score=17.15 GEMP01108974.1:151-483(+)